MSLAAAHGGCFNGLSNRYSDSYFLSLGRKPVKQMPKVDALECDYYRPTKVVKDIPVSFVAQV